MRYTTNKELSELPNSRAVLVPSSRGYQASITAWYPAPNNSRAPMFNLILAADGLQCLSYIRHRHRRDDNASVYTKAIVTAVAYQGSSGSISTYSTGSRIPVIQSRIYIYDTMDQKQGRNGPPGCLALARWADWSGMLVGCHVKC